MLNIQILVGRIASKPVTKDVTSGDRTTKVTTFKLMTHEWYKGEEKEEAHDIEAWGEGLAKLLNGATSRLGDTIGFAGQTRHDSWKDAQDVWHNRTWCVIDGNTKVALIARSAKNKREPGEEG